MFPTKDKIRLRSMTAADAFDVAALEAEVFTDPWSQRLYEETLTDGGYDCRVLEWQQSTKRELLGYFCGQQILDEAEVHRIAVPPALRGRGYGQLLLADFLTRMRQAGVKTVFLEVRASNEAAIRLYRKNEFAPAGIRRHYYRNPQEDAVIMRRQF